MPKMKTHKGAAKRFRVTATGKLKRAKRLRNHKLSNRSSRRSRDLAQQTYVTDADVPRIVRLLPYI